VIQFFFYPVNSSISAPSGMPICCLLLGCTLTTLFFKGVYVRNAEKEVAKHLKKYRIQWSYEHPVFVWDENKRPRVWTPDFYIEVCGSKSFDYNYRRKIFDRNGYMVIFFALLQENKQMGGSSTKLSSIIH